jgi:6-phosphogluconate dehydrogenase
MDATVLSCIASYAQGMELLRIASQDLDYELHMPSIAQIWKGLHHSRAPAQADSGCL